MSFQCDPGTFGVAPNCTNIPLVSDLSSVPLVITDVSFGQNRQAAGMDTRWVVRPTEFTRTITIRFSLNQTHFNKYSDVLEVYEGGEDMRAARVAIIRSERAHSLTHSEPDASDGERGEMCA